MNVAVAISDDREHERYPQMKVNRVLRGILLAIGIAAMGALSLGSSMLAVSGGGTFPR